MSVSRLSLGSWLRVVRLELSHEFDQGRDSLDGHRVVQRRSAATDRAMALQVDQVSLGSLSNELSLESLVLAHAEGDVNARAVLCIHLVAVVSLRAVDVIVEHLRALDCLGLHGCETTLLEHVLDIEAAHVDGPAARSVVERIGRA